MTNPQSTYHAYAMTYLELARARSEGEPVPRSVLVRLASSEDQAARAVMRALRDVERARPMRSKDQLLELLKRALPARVA